MVEDAKPPVHPYSAMPPSSQVATTGFKGFAGYETAPYTAMHPSGQVATGFEESASGMSVKELAVTSTCLSIGDVVFQDLGN